jgi:hypothetical protein
MGVDHNSVRDEIVEHIVCCLRPLKQSEADVLKGVRKQLDKLMEGLALAKLPPRDEKYRNSALRLEKALSVVINVMDELPTNVSNDIFRLGNGLGGHIGAKALRGPISNGKFLHDLRVVRGASALLAVTAKIRKRHDLTKRFCADVAYSVVREFSRKSPTTTAGGQFSSVASILYQACTGRPEADLKRACDKKIKIMRQVRTR